MSYYDLTRERQIAFFTLFGCLAIIIAFSYELYNALINSEEDAFLMALWIIVAIFVAYFNIKKIKMINKAIKNYKLVNKQKKTK